LPGGAEKNHKKHPSG